MKKFAFGLLGLLSVFSVQGQDADNLEIQKPWKSSGNVGLLLNQSSFSNWQAGGDNTVSGNLNVNYDINYAKEDWTWDNKIQVNYGLTKLKGEQEKKTNDRLEINSLLGKKMQGNWYYSAFANFKTQLDSGYDKDGVINSHFMSPAYLQIGPGLLWQKSENLKVNIAPATSRFIMVHKHFTALHESFGVKQGKTLEYQLGMSLSGYYKVNLMENVSMENIINLYSNYLDKPQNVVLDYQLNIVMSINKYLSTNFTFQTIYDDQAFSGFQIREMLGVGVNFTF